MKDIDGRGVRLDSLARTRHLVLVTLKAVWCPVCREQLRRLAGRRAEAEACGVAYVVLAPGPAPELASIRKNTGFHHPFVEDVGLKIAASLGLKLSGEEIQPAILLFDRNLRLRWMQAGRNMGAFGEEALFRELGCADWI